MRKLLQRVTPYVKPYWWLWAIALAVSLIEIVLEAKIPEITKEIIDGPISRGSGAATEAIKAVERDALLPLIGLVVALGFTAAALAAVRRLTAAQASHSLEMDMRNDLYAHLQSLHVGFHDAWQSGQLLSRAVYDINSIRRYVGFGFLFLLITTAQFAWVLVKMIELHALLATVVALGLLPIGFLSYSFARKYRVVSRRVQDQQGDLTTIIEEAATGIRIIKAFGRGPQQLRQFRKQAEVVWDSSVEKVSLRARWWPRFDMVVVLLLSAVIVGGGFAVINNPDPTSDATGLTVGGLIAFIGYMNMLIWPVDVLGWILAMGEEAGTATERVFEVFESVPEIQDRPGATAIESSEGSIKLANVSFRYSEERDWVLKGVDLDIRPGETMALVGKTGCGKTTLAMLVPRLYDVQEGTVTLDGHDVRDLTLESLRAQMGLAFEDPILFSASVRENLLMGRPDASDDDLKAALETARAGFVFELPHGLDTRVGEQGHTLSGGQRQRLALARAVLGQPRVLVLDDPLSSVDVHTEAQIEEALESVLVGVTALLVVHRPSTLALADRVALMDDGRVVAVGTHHELMDSEPLYRAVLSQEAEEIVA